MPLYIDDKRLVPAPLVGINKSIRFSDDGRPISSNYELNVQGTLLPNRGSPMSYGWHEDDSEPPRENYNTEGQQHDSLLRKQELLREVFSNPGFRFTYAAEGYDSVYCYPVLTNLSFAPDRWVIRTDYTINLTATELQKGDSEVDAINEASFSLGTSGLNLSSVSDNWTIAEREDGLGPYEINRSVSAVGLANYGSGNIMYPSGNEPWENARIWVEARLASTGFEDNHFSLPLVGGNAYNLVESQETNRIAGSYSVNQKYQYHDQNYIEQRTVNRVIQYPATNSYGPAEISTSVNGSIQGLHPLNDPSGKLVNAYSYWNTLQTILPAILNVSGYTLNTSIVEDQANGILNYTINYLESSGSTTSTFRYKVDYQNNTDATPIVSINGVVEGKDSHGVPTNNWQHAVSGFNAVENTLYTLAFTHINYIYHSIASGDYTSTPSQKSINIDKDAGTVNFNYGFNYSAGGGSNYSDEYTIDLDTENASAVVRAGNPIRGRIQGNIVGSTTGDSPTAKFAAAESGWDTVEALLYTRVNADFSKIGDTNLVLFPGPITKSVTIDRNKGTIGYSALFSTEKSLNPSGVADLTMSIDEDLQHDIFAVQQIPGRAIGPIIQNIGTLSEIIRTININMVMYPNGGYPWAITDRSVPKSISNNLITSGTSDLGSRGSVTGYYLSSDRDSWDWKNGVYNRVYSVVYVPSGS